MHITDVLVISITGDKNLSFDDCVKSRKKDRLLSISFVSFGGDAISAVFSKGYSSFKAIGNAFASVSVVKGVSEPPGLVPVVCLTFADIAVLGNSKFGI